MNPAFLSRISQELGAPEQFVSAAVGLLEEGGAVLFIARYRKEATGGMDEARLREVQERIAYYKDLQQRRAGILKAIDEQGKLSAELREKINSTFVTVELEDYYLPFRGKGTAKALAARQKGLEPLAEYLWNQESDAWSVEEHADVFIDAGRGVTNREEALKGAGDIIAEWISQNSDFRRSLREIMWDTGTVASKVTPARSADKTKYSMYYDRREPVSTIPSHRLLAILRGTKEGILVSSFETDDAKAVEYLINAAIRDKESAFAPFLETVARESYARIMRSSIEDDLLARLKDRSDREAILVFQKNLANLLLSPPGGAMVVMGLDPDGKGGCRLAVVDETGKFLAEGFLRLNPPAKKSKEGSSNSGPQREESVSPQNPPPAENGAEIQTAPVAEAAGAASSDEGASAESLSPAASPESPTEPIAKASEAKDPRAVLKELITQYKPRALAIGDGNGSREIEVFVRQVLSEEKLEGILVVGVSQAGASVYSASRHAREEFPNLDISARSAVSIARRFQDPLAELVKIDPKSIGVGQYQHDVDQKALHRALVHTLESCVASVGVELNEASPSLLRYVSGIADRLARKIIEHKGSNGPFPSRAALLSVPGMGEKNFLHAAGFLRIRGGENPLDATAVHPESYPLVEKMAAVLGLSLGELIGNKSALLNLKLEDFTTDTVGLPSLQDIREELIKPARDPRKTFALPKFREDVRAITDIKAGMTLEGRVTNVTNFGAFVDVGVRQDGLVHLSQMSNRFIRDPRDAVQVGDVVQVKVISVEEETKRIGLSIKALLPAVQRRRKRPRREGARPRTGAPSQLSTAEGAEQPAVSADSSQVRPSSGDRPRRPDRRPSRERDRGPRRGPRRDRRPAEQIQPHPEAQVPELTMQEKIALLQSKFRGIN
jgi:uncharacterized protein